MARKPFTRANLTVRDEGVGALDGSLGDGWGFVVEAVVVDTS